jgi:hypothetical protein
VGRAVGVAMGAVGVGYGAGDSLTHLLSYSLTYFWLTSKLALTHREGLSPRRTLLTNDHVPRTLGCVEKRPKPLPTTKGTLPASCPGRWLLSIVGSPRIAASAMVPGPAW